MGAASYEFPGLRSSIRGAANPHARRPKIAASFVSAEAKARSTFLGMADEGNDGDAPRHDEERRTRFSRLGEQLTGLLDPESAIRRGQGLVTGVSKATKEELMRLVGVEVRSFLDKMDIADLAQQIIAGLEVDVRMQVKFSRSADGKPVPEVRKSSASVRSEPKTADDRDAAGRAGRGKEPPEEA